MIVTPQLISLGGSANDGTGDSLRAAGTKINAALTALADAVNTGAGALETVAPEKLTQAGTLTDKSAFVMTDGQTSMLAVKAAVLPTFMTTHELEAGGTLADADEIDVFSISSQRSVKFTMTQFVAYLSAKLGSTGSTGGSGGSSYPSLTFSSPPTYDSSGKFGAGDLTAGAATAPIDLGEGNNKFCIEFFMQGAAGGQSFNEGIFMGLSDGTHTIGAQMSFRSVVAVADNGANGEYGFNAYDGGWHYCAVDFDGGRCNVSTDSGSNSSTRSGAFNGGSNCTLKVGPLPSGVKLDAIKVSKVSKFPYGTAITVPGSAPTHDADTVGIWQLDGNGAGT